MKYLFERCVAFITSKCRQHISENIHNDINGVTGWYKTENTIILSNVHKKFLSPYKIKYHPVLQIDTKLKNPNLVRMVTTTIGLSTWPFWSNMVNSGWTVLLTLYLSKTDANYIFLLILNSNHHKWRSQSMYGYIESLITYLGYRMDSRREVRTEDNE